MPLIGIGNGTPSGPKFLCPDGVTAVYSTSDCPGGSPVGAGSSPGLTPAEQQIQAEIDALFAYTQAGQANQPGGAGMPTGSTPAPAATPTNWGTIAVIVAAAAVLMAMTRR